MEQRLEPPKIEIIERNGEKIVTTTTKINGIVSVYEQRPCCFCCTDNFLVSTTVDPDYHKTNDESTTKDLDIFMSTTDVIGDMQVRKNFGMVSSTYAGTKDRNLGMVNWPILVGNIADGVELVRSNALAGLRSKAKMIGANAVIGVRIDVENTDIGIRSISVAVATGTAVLLSQPPFDISTTDFKYPPYFPSML
jgi:uncharacterized protein YbjQ (UPF0145 family)